MYLVHCSNLRCTQTHVFATSTTSTSAISFPFFSWPLFQASWRIRPLEDMSRLRKITCCKYSCFLLLGESGITSIFEVDEVVIEDWDLATEISATIKLLRILYAGGIPSSALCCLYMIQRPKRLMMVELEPKAIAIHAAVELESVLIVTFTFLILKREIFASYEPYPCLII